VAAVIPPSVARAAGYGTGLAGGPGRLPRREIGYAAAPIAGGGDAWLAGFHGAQSKPFIRHISTRREMSIALPCNVIRKNEHASAPATEARRPHRRGGARGAGRRAALLLPWAQDLVLQELADMVDKALRDVASADK